MKDYYKILLRAVLFFLKKKNIYIYINIIILFILTKKCCMWVHMRSKLGWKEIGNCINNELYWRYTLLRVHHGTDAYSLWTIVNNRHQLHLFLVYVCFGYLLDYLTLAVMSNRSANEAPLRPLPWNLENTSRVCWFFGGLPPFFSLLHFLPLFDIFYT